jgi:hypothetical protein
MTRTQIFELAGTKVWNFKVKDCWALMLRKGALAATAAAVLIIFLR